MFSVITSTQYITGGTTLNKKKKRHKDEKELKMFLFTDAIIDYKILRNL